MWKWLCSWKILDYLQQCLVNGVSVYHKRLKYDSKGRRWYRRANSSDGEKWWDKELYPSTRAFVTESEPSTIKRAFAWVLFEIWIFLLSPGPMRCLAYRTEKTKSEFSNQMLWPHSLMKALMGSWSTCRQISNARQDLVSFTMPYKWLFFWT